MSFSALRLLAFALIVLPAHLPAFQTQAAIPPARATLTYQQKQLLKSAESDVNSRIAPMADKISRTAKDLNRALLAEKPDPELRRKLEDDFAKAVSQLVEAAIRLRVSSLQSIIQTLSPDQKKLLLSELDKPGTDADLLNVMKKVFGENETKSK